MQALASDIPVMFGVLTTDTIEQAIETSGNKELAIRDSTARMGAIEMVNLIRSMD